MKPYASLTGLLLLSAGLYAGGFSFAKSGLTGWQEKSFVGHTDYRLVDEVDGKVLHAKSNYSASGLFHQRQIDLEQFPILKWSWKIKQLGRENDEKSRSGDDYPVRLYVIVKGEPYFWNNIALEYVWSNHAELEEVWDNPFSSDFKHVVVESGDEHVGEWRSYERDVVADFSRVFGFRPEKVDAIAIMTDGDNSKQKFEAWYGDIEFNEEH